VENLARGSVDPDVTLLGPVESTHCRVDEQVLGRIYNMAAFNNTRNQAKSAV
jgi:hypothetical protein